MNSLTYFFCGLLLVLSHYTLGQDGQLNLLKAKPEKFIANQP